MAEDTDQLRQQIHERRSSIAGTVDQIENRVSPARIAARRTTRLRRRLTDVADSIFGNDEPDYDDHRRPMPRSAADDDHQSSTGRSTTRDGTDEDPSRIDQLQGFAPSPDDVRRRARGNPVAAGLISFGAGLLLGSVIPASRRERQIAQQAEPQLRSVAREAAASGQTVASALQGHAESAAGDLKSSAADHARELKSEASSAASDVKDAAT